MPFALGSAASFGIAFLVSAALVDEKIAKDCSSPQTAEINIRKRHDTLMKWVHIGQVEAALFIAIAAYFDKRNRGPILFGGILSMSITEALYLYAKASGLNNPGPETEEY